MSSLSVFFIFLLLITAEINIVKNMLNTVFKIVYFDV